MFPFLGSKHGQINHFINTFIEFINNLFQRYIQVHWYLARMVESHSGWVIACCLSPPPPHQALCCCLTPYPVNPLNLPGGVCLWECLPFSAFCLPLNRRNYENSTRAIYSPGEKQPLLYSQIHTLNLMIPYV